MSAKKKAARKSSNEPFELTSEQLERLGKSIRRHQAELRKQQQSLGLWRKKVGECRVCKGMIVRETKREYQGDPMQAIIGPGFQNQLTTVVVLYCNNCGIRYHRLPKK